MAGYCLVCKDECLSILANDPEVKGRISNVICKLYNFSLEELQIHDIISCPSCFEALVEIEGLINTLKHIQQQLTKTKEKFEEKIRGSCQKYATPMGPICNSVREKILGQIGSNANALEDDSEDAEFEPVTCSRDPDEELQYEDHSAILSTPFNENTEEPIDLKPFEIYTEESTPMSKENLVDNLIVPKIRKKTRRNQSLLKKDTTVQDPSSGQYAAFVLKEARILLRKLPANLPFDSSMSLSSRDPTLKAFAVYDSSFLPHCTKPQSKYISKYKLRTMAPKHQCPDCGLKAFRTRETLRKHRRKFHPASILANCELSRTCKICHKVLLSHTILINHLKTHNKSRIFPCPVEDCKKEFYRENYLKTHIKAKHPARGEESKFSCSQCPKTFPTKHQMSEHVKCVHCTSRDFVCPHEGCPKNYKSRSGLIQHLASHDGKRSWICSICSKSLISKRTLELHQKTFHTDSSERTKLICHYCGSSFCSKYYLNTHIKTIHEKELHFKCEYEGCDRAFFSAGLLNKHNQQHIKPFLCSICPKRFARDGSRSDHEKTHSDDRPILCPHCPLRFKRELGLNEHLLNRHNPEGNTHPFSCPDCGKKFTTMRYVYRHKGKCPAKMNQNDITKTD